MLEAPTGTPAFAPWKDDICDDFDDLYDDQDVTFVPTNTNFPTVPGMCATKITELNALKAEDAMLLKCLTKEAWLNGELQMACSDQIIKF